MGVCVISIGRVSRATECLNATVVGISGQWPVAYLAFQEVACPHHKSHKPWLTRVLSLNVTVECTFINLSLIAICANSVLVLSVL